LWNKIIDLQDLLVEQGMKMGKKVFANASKKKRCKVNEFTTRWG
jgi:hypothetical protein